MIDFLADARSIITNGPFSETIKYWPYQGAPRDIQAIVMRDIPNVEAVPGGREAVYETFHIEVINSDVDGIARHHAQDAVEIKRNPTDLTLTKYQIVQVLIKDDPGVRVYEVKRAA